MIEGEDHLDYVHVNTIFSLRESLFCITRYSIKERARGYSLPKPYSEVPSSMFLTMRLFRIVLENILLLRHPDIGALREPKPLAGMLRLDERATNLAPVLLSLQAKLGGFSERIQRIFKELFPSLGIRLHTKFGRVAILCEEDGLELPPSNIADGAIKLLSILTAIELKPSILLIDEIENSMHARMLEYVVDELDSLDIPVVVATHSPVVVDLVGSEKTIIYLFVEDTYGVGFHRHIISELVRI